MAGWLFSHTARHAHQVAAQQTTSAINSRTPLRLRPAVPAFSPDDAGFNGSSPIVPVIVPPNSSLDSRWTASIRRDRSPDFKTNSVGHDVQNV
jgi:hypothetical protein